MKRLTIVLDNAPQAPAEWMRQLCQSAQLTLIEQDEIPEILSKNEDFQKALFHPQITDPSRPHPSLVPFYRTALEQRVSALPRIALHGWGWLLYAPKVDGCIFDFAGMQPETERLLAMGLPRPQVDEHIRKTQDLMREYARKVLPPAKILELPSQGTAQQKAAQALAFLQKLLV